MDMKSVSILEEFKKMKVGENAEQTEEKKPESIEVKLSRAGIPKRYINSSFEQITKTGCPETVRSLAEIAYRYSNRLKENIKQGRGLLFYGEVGLMKTTLACCVAREAVRQGVGVYFISMPELLDAMTVMSRNKDPAEFRAFEDRIKHVSILILDDFGAEYPAGWVLNKVDAIITNRYNNMLPTIITTNMLPDEIDERYVKRVFDRLRSTSTMVGAYGKSLRGDAG